MYQLDTLHRVATVDDLEAIVGHPSPMILGKQIDALDEGCVRIITTAPVAGLGFRDLDGRPHSTFVGGEAGFFHVDSPRRIWLPLEDEEIEPAPGSGISFVFLLPGIGEQLKVNGRVRSGPRGRLVVDVNEAWVNCARCVLRSGLWDHPQPAPTAPAVGVAPASHAAGPLTDPQITTFLAASPFLVVSTWDARGTSDTSAKGDPPGLLHVVDDGTLAMPDRKGNQRADTLHNLLGDAAVALAAVVPGRTEVLRVRGTGQITDDPALLSGMALNGKPPQAALLIDVTHAEIVTSPALRRSRLWDPAARVDRSAIPDLMALGARHLAANQTGEITGATRLLARPLAAFPRLTRFVINLGYRSQLNSEGYSGEATKRPGCGRRRLGSRLHQWLRRHR